MIGFKYSRTFPLNPDAFDDKDFAPVSVTEILNLHEPTVSQAGQGSTQNEADIEPLTPANSKQRADPSEVNTPAAVHIFTARRYASAVLAVIVCLSVRPSVRLSVRPSQVRVVQRWLNLGSD